MGDMTINAGTCKEWRSWLRKNHLKEKKVVLIRHKVHTGKPTMTSKETMQEAICFGWIDTTIRRIDEDRFAQTFVRRSEKSKWSDNTLRYAKELIGQKKMSPFGLKMYKLGLQKPTHDHGIPKDPDMPEELKKKLKGKKDKELFEKVSPSRRRMYYRWILRAKLAETRQKRVTIVYQAVCAGKKIFSQE